MLLIRQPTNRQLLEKETDTQTPSSCMKNHQTWVTWKPSWSSEEAMKVAFSGHKYIEKRSETRLPDVFGMQDNVALFRNKDILIPELE